MLYPWVNDDAESYVLDKIKYRLTKVHHFLSLKGVNLGSHFYGYVPVFPSSREDSFTGFYSKACVKQPLSKRQKIDFQDQLSLNAGQKYCRMLQGEHFAILSTFIKLPLVIKIFVLSIFK